MVNSGQKVKWLKSVRERERGKGYKTIKSKKQEI